MEGQPVLIPATIEQDLKNGTLKVVINAGRGDYVLYIRKDKIKIALFGRIKQWIMGLLSFR